MTEDFYKKLNEAYRNEYEGSVDPSEELIQFSSETAQRLLVRVLDRISAVLDENSSQGIRDDDRERNRDLIQLFSMLNLIPATWASTLGLGTSVRHCVEVEGSKLLVGLMRENHRESIGQDHPVHEPKEPTFREIAQELAGWSQEAFGPDAERGPIGALKHLAKEAMEAVDDPSDVKEYADCLILVLDSSRRGGFEPEDILKAAWEKIHENKGRDWPDWRSAPKDEPIEHIREEEPHYCTRCGQPGLVVGPVYTFCRSCAPFGYHNKGIKTCGGCFSTNFDFRYETGVLLCGDCGRNLTSEHKVRQEERDRDFYKRRQVPGATLDKCPSCEGTNTVRLVGNGSEIHCRTCGNRFGVPLVGGH